MTAAAGGLVVATTGSAFAQVAQAGSQGAGSMLHVLAGRLEHTIQHIPSLSEHLGRLPNIVGARVALLLIGLLLAGLLAEYVARLILQRLFQSRFDGTGLSWRAVARGALLDVVALLALWVAGRLVLGAMGDSQSVGGRLGHQFLLGLVHWRVFSLLFRVWLRPEVPANRIAPVDNGMARRLLVALNLMILLPLIGEHLEKALANSGAGADAESVADLFYTAVMSLALLAVIWHSRRDMAAWFLAMVPDGGRFRQLKADAARNWWIAALVFYAGAGVAEIYGELSGNDAAPVGMDIIETALMALLLFETLMYRVTRHIQTELPLAGDVVSDCIRLAVRLFVAIRIAEAVMVKVLAAATPVEWAAHDRGAKIAAITAIAIYAFWRFLKYRMDSYIAANPLPSADASGDSEDDAKVAASRLRTLMPLLRAISGVIIAIVGTLLVLSELGVNITPLIAGASVLGLAVSFGSQSLVRDVVSGIFFLAEDSFRIGEYLDCSKVKGTVEGFSVRCLKLRHQNGQLHIVPFGQVGHITNFSRDWTVVKFSLAFARGTDVELLRKTVKKMGLDMMEEPTFKPILLQPLKMQGVVDIKDNSLIVRFKFMARPKNPSAVQRMAIRRMYEQFPKLGIEFAQAMPFPFPYPVAPGAAPAAAPAPAAPAAVHAAD
jgi:small-conductance mechanosensitive channel